MAIYITGDTHIPIDINKLNTKNFPEQKNMTKDDYVIICGDFGGVWDNSKEELYWRKWLNERNFTTLFCDGNHEGFHLLNEMPVKNWNGGKVHVVEDSVLHLMRGHVFYLEGLEFFVMGGGTSIDKMHRVEGKSWWPEELPSDKEYDQAMICLQTRNWKVDYVISHTTSRRKMEEMGFMKENSKLNSFFNLLEDDLEYKKWFFGHFHDDREMIDGKGIMLYEKIYKLT